MKQSFYKLLLMLAGILPSRLTAIATIDKTTSGYIHLNNTVTIPSGGISESVTDNKYQVMDPGSMNYNANWSQLFTNNSAKGRIWVMVDMNRSTAKAPSERYSAEVKISYTYYKYGNGNFQSYTPAGGYHIFHINFSNQGAFIDRDVLEINDAYRVEITVDQVTIQSSPSTPQYNLKVFAETEVARTYIFFPTSSPANLAHYAPFSTNNPDNPDLKISWDAISGAKYYDLEWTYVSYYTSVTNPANIPFFERNFQFNSTRISTAENHFSIPLIYPKGYIVYRVRAVGDIVQNNTTYLVEGTWNQYTNPSGGALSDFYYYSHQADAGFSFGYNWQMSADFAEDGKSIYSIAYFDGTLRQRQQQTRNNVPITVNKYSNSSQSIQVQTALISESIYDHQGRPAINVLPVPYRMPNDVLSPDFKFIPSFNKYNSITKYNRDHFDLDNGELCDPLISPMASSSGSSKYFSSQNELIQANSNDNNIPDAEEYPFAQTTYTPDNTGRIREQGGVGINHQVGSGHETKYIYSKPLQEELNRLFGSEAGYAEHYKKNLVIDPNGQISISYINFRGQVVATSLAGQSPAKVDALPSYNPNPSFATVDLLGKTVATNNSGNNNVLDLPSKSLTMGMSFAVTTPGIQYFAYKMNGTKHTEACNNNPICFDCVLDLKISVKDLCGNEYLTGINPNDASSNQVTIGSDILALINSGEAVTCGTSTPPSITKGFGAGSAPEWATHNSSGEIELPTGEYSISKVLTINEQALDYYTNKYLASTTCLKTFDEFLDEEEAKIDLTGCNITCETCAQRLAAKQSEYSQEEYAALLAKCYEPCTNLDPCLNSYNLMLTDVTPGGQYGNTSEEGHFYRGVFYGPFVYGTDSGEIDPTLFPLSVYNTFNLLPRKEYIYNDFYTNYNPYIASLWTPSWKFPYNPDQAVGPKRFSYLDENGDPAYIEVKLVEGEFVPAIDQRFIAFLDIRSDGSLWIPPQFLIHLADFEKIRKTWWSASLVTYHPEFGYYADCSRRANSRSFDRELASIDDMTNDQNSPCVRFDAFKTTYGISANSDLSHLYDYDPYFDTQQYNSANSLDYYILNFYDVSAEKTAFASVCTNYFTVGSTTISMLEYAYMLAHCETDRNFPATQSCSPCHPSNWPSTVTLTTDKEWLIYRSLYTSLKQRFAQWRADMLAIESHSYNGCIGTSTFDVSKYGYYFNEQPSPYSIFYDVYPWNSYPKPNASLVGPMFNTEFYNPEQTCNVATYFLYSGKTPRFGAAGTMMGLKRLDEPKLYSPSDTFPATDPATYQDVINDISKDVKDIVDVKRKEECQQCPADASLEALMNALLANNKLYNNTPTPEPLHCDNNGNKGYAQFDPTLEAAVMSPAPSQSASTTTYPNDFNWEGEVVTGGTAPDNYKRLEVGFNSPSNISANKGFYIEFRGTDATLYDFNNTDIVSFCCLKHNPYVSDLNQLQIKVNVHVDPNDPDYNGDPEQIKQITLYGYNSFLRTRDNYEFSAISGLSSCSEGPVCKTSSTAYSVQNLLNVFVHHNQNSLGTTGNILETPYNMVLSPGFLDEIRTVLTIGPDLGQDGLCGEMKYNTTLSVASNNQLQLVFSHTRLNTTIAPCSTYADKSCTVTLTDLSGASYNGIGNSSVAIYGFSDIHYVNDPNNPNVNFYITACIRQNNGTPQYVKLEGYSSCLIMGSCSSNPTYSALEFPMDEAIKPDDVYLSSKPPKTMAQEKHDCIYNVPELNKVKNFLNDRIDDAKEATLGDGGLQTSLFDQIDYLAAFPKTKGIHTLQMGDCFIKVFDPQTDFSPALNYSLSDIEVFLTIERDFSKNGKSYPSNTFPVSGGTEYSKPIYSHGHFVATAKLKNGTVVKVYGYAPCVDTTTCPPAPVGFGCGQLLYATNFEDTTYKVPDPNHPPDSISYCQPNDFHLDTDFDLCTSCNNICPGCSTACTTAVFNISSPPFTSGHNEYCVKRVQFSSLDENAMVYQILDGTSNIKLWQYDHLVTGANAGIDKVSVQNYRDYQFKFKSLALGGCSESDITYTLKINNKVIPLTGTSNAGITEYTGVVNFDGHSDADIQLLVSYVSNTSLGNTCLFAVTEFALEYMCNQRLCCPVPVANVTVDDPCEQRQLKLAYFNAKQKYDAYIKEERTAFRERYVQHCLDVYEDFFMKTKNLSGEHHFTLYYYDQAGNLERTVPPEGVNLITDPGKLQKINMDREKGTHTVFTNHSYTTTYKYNSLNQLVHQTMPDQDDMNIWKWEQLNNGLNSNFNSSDIHFFNTAKGLLTGELTGSGYGRVYNTLDGGSSWNEINALGVKDLFYTTFINTNLVFACGKKGILLKSTNGGVDWTMVPVPTGGDLIHVHQISGTEGYAYERNGLIWHTTDAGSTWTGPSKNLSLMLKGNITSIHFSSSSADGYVVTDDGKIYKTDDDGQNWVKAYLNVRPAELTALDFTDNSFGIVGGKSGLLMKGTLSAGSEWQVLPNNIRSTIDDIHTASNTTWCYIAGGNIYYTENTGQGYTLIAGISNAVDMHFEDASVGFVITSAFQVYKTTNKGKTWSTLAWSGFTPPSGVNATSVCLNASGTGIFGADNGKIYLRDASGAVTQPYTAGSSIKQVHYYRDATNNSDFYLLLDAGSTLAGFNGSTWSAISSPANIISFHFKNTAVGTGALNQSGGDIIQATFTTGSTVINTTSFSSISGVHHKNKIYASLLSTGSLDIAMAVGSDLILSNPTVTQGVMYVTDPSASNNASDVSGKVLPLPLNAVFVTGNSSSGTVVAVGENGRILRSTNGGDTWLMDHCTYTENLHALTTDGNNNWWTAGDNGRILYLSSSGSGWTNQSTGSTEPLYSLSYYSSNSFAAGKNTLLQYNSSTQTWGNASGIDMTNSTLLAMAVNSAGDFTGVGANGKMARKPNASNWGFVNTLQPPPIVALSMVNTTLGFMVSNDGKLFKTLDGGDSWEMEYALTGINLYDVQAINETKCFVSGKLASANTGILYKLENTNGIWAYTALASVTGAITSVHFSGNTGVATAPGANYIYYTANGGANWQVATTGAGDNPTRSFVLDETMAYFAGSTGLYYIDLSATTPAFTQYSNAPSSVTYTDIWFKDYTTGYAIATNGNVYKTIDGGTSWTSRLWGTSLSFARLCHTDDNNLYVSNTDANNPRAIHIADYADEFSSRFYYDKLGRLVVSQNAKQYAESANTYSYTLYDFKGRISEVGKIEAAYPIENTYRNDQMDQDLFLLWVTEANNRKEVTRTFYDVKKFEGIPIVQENLRNRVVSTTFEALYDGDETTYDQASHYTYDIHGNVNFLLQQNNLIPSQHQFKTIKYDYDLISGVVKSVTYQQDAADQFIHQYEYDANNRLTKVQTSNDGVNWHTDAKYFYYQHGPLSRVELGNDQVQGLDYAYTIHGWIKAVNSNTLLNLNRDPGKDGLPGSTNTNRDFAMDEMGYSLNYYNGDYKPIVGASTQAENFLAGYMDGSNASGLKSSNKDLYNGNISHMVTAIRSFMGGPTGTAQATSYVYDQLNRLMEMTVHNGINMIDNYWKQTSASNAYHENYTYDANGNILTLQRKDQGGILMDDFTYVYQKTGGNFAGSNNVKKNSNRLLAVSDAVTTSTHAGDVKNGQAASGNNPHNYNYDYDELGNLVKDAQEEIASIEWNTYGKISKITRTQNSSKPDLEFAYDASGQRIMKKELRKGGAAAITTWYVRDAQGNIMSTYEEKATENAVVFEQQSLNIYGSSRLGEWAPARMAQSCGGSVTVAGNGVNDLGDVATEAENFLANTIGVTNSDIKTHWDDEWNALATTSGTDYADMDMRTLQALMNGWMQWMCSLRCYTALDNGAWTSLQTEWRTYYVNAIKNRMSNGFAGYDKIFLDNLNLEWQQRCTTFATYITTVNALYDNRCGLTYAKGSRQYELSNHLGNVLVTVSDRKIIVDEAYTWQGPAVSGSDYLLKKGKYEYIAPTGGNPNGDYALTAGADGNISAYLADVQSAQDYYPFGMIMPGRPTEFVSSCSGSQNVQVQQHPVIDGHTLSWQSYEEGIPAYNSSSGKQEIQMADIGSGAFFIIPNTPTNGDAVQVLITAQSGQENGITVGIYDAANNLVGNTLSVSAGGYTSALTFNFNSSSSQHTVRVTANGNPANNHNVFVNGHQQTWTAIGSGSTNYNSGTQQQEITVNADNDGGKVSFSTAANTGQDLFVKVSIQAGGSDVTAGVYDQNGNLVSATDVITAGNSGDLNLVVSNCSSSIHEVRLTGELAQVMTPITLLNNGHTLTWTAWNSGSATYNSGNNTQDITATNAGDGAYYTITGTPTNGNVIDVNLTFTTTTNPVYVGLYDNNNNLVAGPTTVPASSTNQIVNFNLNSSQNQYNLRATSDPVMTIAPSQTVTNGHTQTWSAYNSGSPTYNSGTSTQDVPVTAANDGASFFFSTPNTGEYVNGSITVQAVSNNAVVRIYDNSGNPVTGNFTINAGNTTQVNFNFNSADVQHEVRVVSQLTGGGSYPDIFYISALDIWVTDTTYTPYTFSISQFAVVETTYVPTADVFYVTDLDVTASPYPEKCFVSNLDVNYTVNVTRPVCSSMEEFLANTKGYRYSFNGKMDDSEVEGMQDYGMRIYNKRLGRFLSTDPLEADYPELTPYQFANNNPIWAIDLDGLEARITVAGTGNGDNYKPSDVVSFHKRAMGLKQRYGFSYAGKVNTGAALLNVFKNYTKEQGSILRVVTFAHGGYDGLFLNQDNGMYRMNVSYGGLSEKTVKDLAAAVKSGQIKFDKNAVWTLAACNTANTSGNANFATDITMQTGVTTIAATGYVGPEIVNGKETGRLVTDGTFVKIEKVFNLTYQIDGKSVVNSFSSKSEAEAYNKGFNGDGAYSYTLTEDVKKTDLGNTIDPGKQ
ncbi:MAG: hypothetical protein K1X81_01610 [Bacteroidia bacterium]|nr:hypothetical protein [Bacteroidia bacterium]